MIKKTRTITDFMERLPPIHKSLTSDDQYWWFKVEVSVGTNTELFKVLHALSFLANEALPYKSIYLEKKKIGNKEKIIHIKSMSRYNKKFIERNYKCI